MAGTLVVDGRDMLPPEPMERTLEALDEVGDDGEVLLLLYREPFPLFKILERNGYGHRTTSRDDGTFEIRIRRVA
ncbi:MAG: DUF2249 domain-containing protein [Betaproteobacteria bacterium]|nr:DUF2249 domain-containing protein [Betaproteobacteria bacterium]